MKVKTITGIAVVLLAAFVVFIFPRPFSAKEERKVLYWTDPMIPGDRSDRPGKSPMGMERVPVYAEGPVTAVDAERDSIFYTCPMHQSVRLDHPGACPVCGMALVKKSVNGNSQSVEPVNLEGVSLSATQQVMANITTVPVERRTLKKEVRAVGVVDFAEPDYRHISMRFPGRIDRLYLTYTGQHVRKGDPVADVYSPEAVSAQQEYLLALDSYKQLGDAPGSVRSGASDLIAQARQKLILWDFTDGQIRELAETGKVRYAVTIYSPIGGTVMKKNVEPQRYVAMGENIFDVADLSHVWVYLDVYESNARFVRVGQEVRITTTMYPGEEFSGRVEFIDPVLNADTRTVRVRTAFPNAAGELKPNMFVSARIVTPASHTLVVPASALLTTGRQILVWVEVSPGRFEPRDVVVGERTETYAEILSGVDVGDEVAATGGFLIDSESQLRHPAPAAPVREGKTASREEPFARPSEYFGVHELTAVHNEAGILVKGRYTPDVIHVKVGRPVTLHFYRDEDADCTNEVVFEDFGIRRRLPARETTTITFTPKDTGEVGFECGMGMVRGTLIVEK